MNEIIFALKCIIAFLTVALFVFFMAYFITANDHIITIYLNPFHLNTENYRYNSDYSLSAWQFGTIAFILGACVMYCVCQIKFYKKNLVIDNLHKENKGLKSKFEKVKTDVSKCVT